MNADGQDDCLLGEAAKKTVKSKEIMDEEHNQDQKGLFVKKA